MVHAEICSNIAERTASDFKPAASAILRRIERDVMCTTHCLEHPFHAWPMNAFGPRMSKKDARSSSTFVRADVDP
jgi:hypothetical protein